MTSSPEIIYIYDNLISFTGATHGFIEIKLLNYG